MVFSFNYNALYVNSMFNSLCFFTVNVSPSTKLSTQKLFFLATLSTLGHLCQRAGLTFDICGHLIQNPRHKYLSATSSGEYTASLPHAYCKLQCTV